MATRRPAFAATSPKSGLPVEFLNRDPLEFPEDLLDLMQKTLSEIGADKQVNKIVVVDEDDPIMNPISDEDPWRTKCLGREIIEDGQWTMYIANTSQQTQELMEHAVGHAIQPARAEEHQWVMGEAEADYAQSLVGKMGEIWVSGKDGQDLEDNEWLVIGGRTEKLGERNWDYLEEVGKRDTWEFSNPDKLIEMQESALKGTWRREYFAERARRISEQQEGGNCWIEDYSGKMGWGAKLTVKGLTANDNELTTHLRERGRLVRDQAWKTVEMAHGERVAGGFVRYRRDPNGLLGTDPKTSKTIGELIEFNMAKG
jgi:hypothetical protein